MGSRIVPSLSGSVSALATPSGTTPSVVTGVARSSTFKVGAEMDLVLVVTQLNSNLCSAVEVTRTSELRRGRKIKTWLCTKKKKKKRGFPKKKKKKKKKKKS